MKSVSISGSPRENVGKKDAKMQRRNGLVPCVMYGGEESYHFLVEEKAFKPLLYTPEVLYADLKIGDKEFKAIVQETQFHPITDRLLHVDFLQVTNKPISIAIPLKVEGSSKGVMRGGKLSKKVRKIKVKGLLENIPENIMLNVSDLDILDSIKVGDVKVDNITILDNPANVLVTVLSTRNVESAPAAE